jgi:hypothetical protein
MDALANILNSSVAAIPSRMYKITFWRTHSESDYIYSGE